MNSLFRLSILILFFWHVHSYGGMQTHAYFIELFAKEPVPTEYTAYKLLVDEPLEQDVNYLAVPWTIVIKRKLLHRLQNIRLDGGFTICQHFRFEEIIPLLRKIGIDVLFTPHIEQGKVYDGITVLPFPHFAQNGVNPANEKDILYSFVGTASSQRVREKIFKLPKKKDIAIIERNGWSASTVDKDHNKEYRDILARSRFALAPRGHGVSTIRFWESLQAGAIPVLLADGTLLPSYIDWDACTIVVPEENVAQVDAIIRSISTEDEKRMRENCLIAYSLSSGQNLVRTIRCFYAK